MRFERIVNNADEDVRVLLACFHIAMNLIKALNTRDTYRDRRDKFRGAITIFDIRRYEEEAERWAQELEKITAKLYD